MLILVIVQILLTVAGQVLWKRSFDQSGGFLATGQPIVASLIAIFTNFQFLLGTTLYLGATLLWFYLLSRFELSYVYPFLSLTFIVSFIGARFFLGEQISFQRWIAVSFITFGVLLMTRT
jgi:drug/metabolite transporter (DMT)-like permease